MVGGEAGWVLGEGRRQRLGSQPGGGRRQAVVDVCGGVQADAGVPVVVVSSRRTPR